MSKIKHANISIFLPNAGCDRHCIFCDQHIISKKEKMPTAEDINALCDTACSEISSPENAEIAFFGGSFTALPRCVTEPLLEVADEFTERYNLRGIRISTDPYFLKREQTAFLSKHKISAVELGIQSFDEEVRRKNGRRENGLQDAQTAIENLKTDLNCEIGMQMMTGMFGSTHETDLFTAKQIAAMKPDTVRVYPTVVLRGTELDRLFQNGEFKPYGIDEMALLCAEIQEITDSANIRVIRMGLHSDIDKEKITGGYFHPAFGEIVQSLIMRKRLETMVTEGISELTVKCNPSDVSKVLGHKNMNRIYFSQMGIDLTVKADSTIEINTLSALK
ncbi:MAG: radical SAM protein [Ruminococcus sp.]|jgi:histone acetyltransferase (RNA polymerase elongator complex component)|nr:radical SAM protein [Ruminococcus sp.]